MDSCSPSLQSIGTIIMTSPNGELRVKMEESVLSYQKLCSKMYQNRNGLYSHNLSYSSIWESSEITFCISEYLKDSYIIKSWIYHKLNTMYFKLLNLLCKVYYHWQSICCWHSYWNRLPAGGLQFYHNTQIPFLCICIHVYMDR